MSSPPQAQATSSAERRVPPVALGRAGADARPFKPAEFRTAVPQGVARWAQLVLRVGLACVALIGVGEVAQGPGEAGEVGRPVALEEDAVDQVGGDPAIVEPMAREASLGAEVEVGQGIDLALAVEGRHVHRDREPLHQVGGEDRAASLTPDPFVEQEAGGPLMRSTGRVPAPPVSPQVPLSSRKQGRPGGGQRAVIAIQSCGITSPQVSRSMIGRSSGLWPETRPPDVGHGPLAHARVADDERAEESPGREFRHLAAELEGGPRPPEERDITRLGRLMIDRIAMISCPSEVSFR